MKDFLLVPCRKLRGFVLAAMALASLPVLGLAQAPAIAGLPEAINGTQSAVPFSGPSGPTYSTLTVASAATGPLNSQTANKAYNVWCINPYGYVQPAAEGYTAYSSYDSNLWSKGNAGTQTQWQEINWVLNNQAGHSGTVAATVMDVQNVIWDILIPGYTTNFSAAGPQLLSDAQTYGPGFVPIGGQLVAIVLYNAGINANDGAASVQDLLVPYQLPVTPQVPGIKITKTASVSTAKCTDAVTYTYVVTNSGTTVLTNVKVVDDNATPNYPADDVTIASGVTLQPGQSQTYTRRLPLPLKQVDSYGNSHVLIPQSMPNGDLMFTLLEDTNLVDNTWGKGGSPDWGSNGNTLGNHLGQDSAEFEFFDGNGNVVLDFALDYASLSSSYPSGVGSYGLAGAGHLYAGNPANIEYIGSTLTDNMNASGNAGSWYTNSPPPGNSNWTYQCGYKVLIKWSCFTNGFGGCIIKSIKHGCSKQGNNFQCAPVTACGPVTNTATATGNAVVNGVTKTVTATAQATVQLNDSRYCTPPPPPVCHCTCANCQRGLHSQCLNKGDNDAGCKKLGCQQQQPAPPPAPCAPPRWTQQCWSNFVACGKNW